MQRAILLLLLAFLSAFHGLAQQDKRLKGLDDELNKILEVTKAPGFAVAIVQGDKVIYAKGFGYRDVENKLPADANTLYAIGSCSKSFTCAILGQLRQEDKLSFDDSPIRYIPELKFYNDQLNSHVIIKDLMCHRTGLPRHDYSWYLFPTDNRDSLMLRIEHQEPFAGLREQWYYNNFMFLTQGVIAERITGKSWEDNIRERFFKPLGMERSNVSIEELEKSENAALGYELKGDTLLSKMDYYRIAAMGPAGSINSSVNDMSNWLITWINKGKFKNQEILPESYLGEAVSSQMVIAGGLPDKEFPDIYMANYGYGWMILSYKGHYRVEHGGNIDGFSASVSLFPGDSLGVVVLTNQNASGVPGMVRNTVADRMLGTERTDWAKRYADKKAEAKKNEQETKEKSESSKIANTRPSHILQDYTGNYSNPGYGEFQIANDGDSLFATFKLKKFYLRHYHYDVFELMEVTKTGIDSADAETPRFNFATSEMGEISEVRIRIEPTLDPIAFKHVPTSIDVDKATLESYSGEYELAGATIKVYIKNDSVLYLFIAGQPEYELVPTAPRKFSFKTLEGFKVEFLEAEDKSVNEVMIIQPNGTFKAIRK